MISPSVAEDIWQRVLKTWIQRHGKDKLDPEKLKLTRKLIYELPDDDGCKRVTRMDTGKTYLVPVERIILDGLRGKDVEGFPEVKE